MAKWKITKQNKLLSAELFDVYRQHVLGPRNYERDFDVVVRRPTVAVIPMSEDNSIYIVGQERYMLGRYNWELMAGYVEKNEDPLRGAVRELKEETGITASYWKKLIEVEMSATGIKASSHVFLAKKLKTGKSSPDEGEYITLKKISLENAVKGVLNGKITCSVSALGILMLDSLIKRNKL